MHRYDEAVERIKARNDVLDARQWLELAGPDYGVLWEMDHEESIDAVEECYRRGAKLVEIVGENLENPEDSSADMILVTLPENRDERAHLFELEELIAGMSGYQLSVDEGQQYMLLRWS